MAVHGNTRGRADAANYKHVIASARLARPVHPIATPIFFPNTRPDRPILLISTLNCSCDCTFSPTPGTTILCPPLYLYFSNSTPVRPKVSATTPTSVIVNHDHNHGREHAHNNCTTGMATQEAETWQVSVEKNVAEVQSEFTIYPEAYPYCRRL